MAAKKKTTRKPEGRGGKVKQVKKAFERTRKPPRPAAPEAAYDDDAADEGGAGVMPPLVDDD